ncbi:hypothetical protein ACFL1L_04840 [Thermoplasmatota archaeon]
MDKTTKITLLGIILGAFIFIGFYLSSLYDLNIIGIPPLEEFIAMLGVLIFIISGFFYFSLKTINQKKKNDDNLIP